jgi:5'-3' exonuclease
MIFIDGDVLIHSCLWETKTLEEFKTNVPITMEKWLEGAFDDDYVMAVGPRKGANYRSWIYPEYKKTVTREKSRKKRLDYTDEAKEFIYNYPGVVIAPDDIEADDLLGHWSTERPDGVICTIDKDLNQLPGIHYTPYYKNPRLYEVSLEEANQFFCYQMLCGDSIDNIPGVPGVGPVKAKEILKGFKDLRTGLPDFYIERFGNDWRDWFLSNGKMLFIQRRPGQYFSMNTYEELFHGHKAGTNTVDSESLRLSGAD